LDLDLSVPVAVTQSCLLDLDLSVPVAVTQSCLLDLDLSVPVAVTQSCLLGLDNLHTHTVQHLDIIRVFSLPTDAKCCASVGKVNNL
jgi:hypothetical protein